MPVRQRPRWGGLSPTEFFKALPVAVAPRLPAELRGFEFGREGRLMKFDYGHPETHFEVWHHPSTAHLEVGLHFEGPALLNDDAHRFFRPRMLEVKRGLPRAELEPWDRGWARLYETCAATDLSHELLNPAAALLAAYIATLQPMLDAFWESRS